MRVINFYSELGFLPELEPKCQLTSVKLSPAYEIQFATEENKDEIIVYLREIFFKDEPLNSYLQLVTEDSPSCEPLEEFSVKNLHNGINLMVVHRGKIVGLCLNVIVERGKEEPFICGDEKCDKIVDILDYADRQCDPFALYPDCDRGVSVQVISVEEHHRGNGIATKLLAKTRELARQRGCGFIAIGCTGKFSAKVAEKLGFKLQYSLKYADYKVNGKVVFEPEAPHSSLTVYTQRLQLDS
ncbi:arylalkylamine N-acetyltransferase 1 isoform X1 [Leptinotarsa decemlineata]|uniref:arylalkylamine N-acetyltransferase 1 isoform X1 n=1 Tax=Leptinotarsa decemlineata TaxID=7539 RepID=UPI003D30BD9A